MSAALVTGAMAAAGIYLLLQRGMVRLVLGFLLLQHAVNVLLVTRRAPQRDDAAILPVNAPADALGQAFALTSIVIGLGSAVLLLAITLRHLRLHRDRSGDPDDPEAPS